MAGLNLFGFSNAESGKIASGIFGAAGSLASFLGNRATSKAKRAYQEYTNTMVNFSNAASQDAITMNEIMYNVASTDKAKTIQEGGMAAEASLEASAAAAGVAGNSVEVAKSHVEGNAALAEFTRQRDYKFAMFGFDTQRKSAALSAATSKDLSDYSAGDSAQSWAAVLKGGYSIASILGAW